MKTVNYHFYKIIDGCSVYQPYVNIERKYSIVLHGMERKPVILVQNGEIKNVYINGYNYQAERYLKKYRNNKQLLSVIEELKKEA